MSNTKHTPTPWHYGKMSGWGGLCILRRPGAEYGPEGVIGDAPIAIVVEKAAHWENSYPVEANAAFIVKAVNSHEQLVAALRQVADVLDAFGNLPDGMMHPSPWNDHKAEDKIKAARAALAAAEAA